MAEQHFAMANIIGYQRVFTTIIQSPSHFALTVTNDPVATLGTLAILPNELLEDIISKHCDIQTIVTSFSLVNRSTRKAVDATVAFQRISHYAPIALIAMLRTQAASFFTLEDLYDALCSNSSCRVCGSFGPLLWLPECQRCCMPCLRRAPEYCPINKYAATKLFGVSEGVLASVPAVFSERGWDDYQDFRHLLSFAQARAAAVEDAGGEAQFMARINSVPRRREAYDSYISRTCISERGNTARFIVAAPLPYFDGHSGKIVEGYFCAGCRCLFNSDRTLHRDTIYDEARRYNTVYTISDLVHHVQTDCPDGQRIWKKHLKESKQGN
ncbi:hypothetical protein ARMSODRAFT_973499 [Armillaria solidipes]|uniref:F-box domain-containing protein n=1 Tax=Armillaria solidipes TaxID=1076256 RepID=A0A2H3C0W1_9AGAR|nr:hypothetical protein ARMSODRAFT_973499 [Armillaria solidipes]